MGEVNTFGIVSLIIGAALGLGGMAFSYWMYRKGEAAGRKETERSIRLDSLASLRREIIEARQFFNDWFAPLTTGTDWKADPDMATDAGKKVDAIRITCRAVQCHLGSAQTEVVGSLVNKFGSDYLEFSYACKHRLPDLQKQKAEEMQRWFAHELEEILNNVLTQGRRANS